MNKLFLAVAMAAVLSTPALAQPASTTANPSDQMKVQRSSGSYSNMRVAQAGCGALPTLGTGFGTGATVAGAGACSFAITIGTSPSATGILTFAQKATNGWTCGGADVTTNSTSIFITKQTATSTTTCTIGNFSDVAVGGAWTAADVVVVRARPY